MSQEIKELGFGEETSVGEISSWPLTSIYVERGDPYIKGVDCPVNTATLERHGCFNLFKKLLIGH